MLTSPEEMNNMVFYRDVSHQDLSVRLIHLAEVNVYVSRQLKPHEMKYLTRDLELRARIFLPSRFGDLVSKG